MADRSASSDRPIPGTQPLRGKAHAPGKSPDAIVNVIQWRERLRRFGLEPSDPLIESEHARQVALFFAERMG